MIFAQGLGLIAMGLDLYAATRRDDRKMIIFNTCGSLTFALHFILLGAFAGTLSETVNAARTGLSLRLRSKYIGLFFASLYTLLMITQSETWIDICPYLCGVIITLGIYFTQGINLRLCYMAGHSLWLVYSIAVFSIGGIILFSATLITFSLMVKRLHDDHKRLLEP